MIKTITTLSISLLLSTSFAWSAEDAQLGHSNMINGQIGHSNMSMSGMSDVGMSDVGMSDVGMSDVGMSAEGAKPNKVVYVILSDDIKITFKQEVKIEPNDVVQFVVMNAGKIDHEFKIGSENEQFDHRKMMKNMSHSHHDSENSITVTPGKEKQIIWHFHGENKVEFACNIVGHAESGMVKKITL